eukprot:SAG31_NODE_777_length_12167_cov_6.570683_10_plen_198_part_00
MWYETADALPNGFQVINANDVQGAYTVAHPQNTLVGAHDSLTHEFSRSTYSGLPVAPPKSRRKDFPNVFRLQTEDRKFILVCSRTLQFCGSALAYQLVHCRFCCMGRLLTLQKTNLSGRQPSQRSKTLHQKKTKNGSRSNLLRYHQLIAPSCTNYQNCCSALTCSSCFGRLYLYRSLAATAKQNRWLISCPYVHSGD